MEIVYYMEKDNRINGELKCILSGLDYYAFYMVNLKHHLSLNTYYKDYEYIDNKLVNIILPYRNDAIPKLEEYLQMLQLITVDYISDAVSVTDFTLSTWDNEPYPIEKEQKARECQIQTILQGKHATEQFICQTIELLKIMWQTSPIKEEIDSLQAAIDKIFEDWKNYGYMEESEYKRFVEYIYQFVKEKQMPEISPKLGIPQKGTKQIPKGVLYHLFHKLYIQCGQRGSLNLYSELIISLFKGFEEKMITDLSSDLSNYATYQGRFEY